MALLGKLLVDRGILSADQLKDALQAQDRLTAMGLEKLLGDLLIAKGYATPDQIREVLEEQQKHVVVCGGCRVQFNIRSQDLGTEMPCPRCGRNVQVPQELTDFNVAATVEPTYIDPGPAPLVYVVVKSYDGEDDAYPLREGEKVTLGTDSECRVRFEGEGVEPLHAEISVIQSTVIISDRSAREGIYINGRRVTSCILRVGDLVLLGRQPIMLSPGLPSGRDTLYEGQRESLLEADPTSLVGRTVGKFRFVRVLGMGGMAVVLLADQLPLNRPVAVKVLRKEMVPNRRAVDRFIREALAGARLNHHNIVQTYDAGTLGGLMFISMEFVEGEDVGMWIKRFGHLPVGLALSISVQVALALEFAHQHGVIHRDVKPSNIMFTSDGRVKLLDLGIAKVLRETAPEGKKMGIGTLVYMPPEQTRDAATVDHRADIYSLGATLYKMLVGQPPFKHKEVEGMVKSIRRDPLPDPRTFVPEVPSRVVDILNVAMAKDPAHRHQSMKELQEDLVGAWNSLQE